MLREAVGLLLLIFPFFTAAVKFTPPKYSGCHSKDFGYGGTVCVCSEELGCDSFSEGTSPLSKHKYAVYTSSKAGDRFSLKTGKFRLLSDSEEESTRAEVKFTVDRKEVYQKIHGIGGSFTGLYRYILNKFCMHCSRQ